MKDKSIAVTSFINENVQNVADDAMSKN